MPSYEIRIKRHYQDYDLACKACYRQLYRNAIIVMEHSGKQLLIRLGCQVTTYKLKDIHERDINCSNDQFLHTNLKFLNFFFIILFSNFNFPFLVF